jgi:hypothetical protein
MNTTEVLDDAEKFYRHLNGIPEEEYPKDELDDIILNAVRIKYPDAKVHSTLLFSSYDLENLYRYKMMKRMIGSMIIVEPDYSTLNPSLNYGVEIPQIPLELYIDIFINDNRPFDNSFRVSYDYNLWTHITTLVNSKLESLELLSHYLNQNNNFSDQYSVL